MAIYSLASRTTNVTTGNPCWELRSGANDRPRLMELGIFMAAATASTFGLGFPQAIGVTPTSPVTVQAEQGDGTGTAQVALAWATPPTIPLNFFRRISLPNVIGTGVIWTFPKGLVIPVSSSIIVWNLSATGVSDIYCVVDE